MIYNREKMLHNISKNLGREANTTTTPTRKWKHAPQWEVYRGYTQKQLVDILAEQCSKIHTDFIQTSEEYLPKR